MKICIVASAHIRNSEMCSPEWISALEKERIESGADIIIAHDSWKEPDLGLPKERKVFDYEAQKKELGKDLYKSFKQFHKNCSIKNFGLWCAYKNNYDMAIVIDSDCIISPGFVKEHIKSLQTPGDGWHNPLLHHLENPVYSRGFPYSKRNLKKWAHMGLWTNETDLYGKDRIGLELHQKLKKLENFPEHVSVSSFFPLSGMNVSFVREAIPYMIFLPVFYHEGQKFNRHDDIWGGYIFQKIANIKNFCLSYGLPHVFHNTIVDPEADAKEEAAMIKYEDEFYQLVDRAINHATTDSKLSHDHFFSILEKELRSEKKFRPLADALSHHIKAYS